MKNISKKIITLIIMLVVALSGATIVKADSSVTVSLTSDSKLVAGETVVVNVNLTSAGDSGVNGISTKLDYDTSIFEEVKMAGVNDWFAYLASSTNIATIELDTITNSPVQMATITLKVKEGVTAKSTTITIKNVKATDSNNTISVADASVTIYAPDDGSGDPDDGSEDPDDGSGDPDDGSGDPDNGSGDPDDGSGNPDNGSGDPDNGSGNPDNGSGTPDGTNNDSGNAGASDDNSSNGNNASKIAEDKTKSTATRLPAAGVTTAVVSIIVVIGIIGIVFYIKYAQNKDIK